MDTKKHPVIYIFGYGIPLPEQPKQGLIENWVVSKKTDHCLWLKPADLITVRLFETADGIKRHHDINVQHECGVTAFEFIDEFIKQVQQL